MEYLRQLLVSIIVWFRRIRYCRGFGIQSPTDYWFVRYVINEHWPYYQYETLGIKDDRITRKLGRLYFRIANWRQPDVIESEDYQTYMKAGCHKASFAESDELVLVGQYDSLKRNAPYIYNKVEQGALLIIDGIRNDMTFWRSLIDKDHLITFDLYYCGIILYDKKRYQQHYIINF